MSTPTQFPCPHCGTVVSVDAPQPGQTIACGHCKGTFTVPPAPPPGVTVVEPVVEQATEAGGVGWNLARTAMLLAVIVAFGIGVWLIQRSKIGL